MTVAKGSLSTTRPQTNRLLQTVRRQLSARDWFAASSWLPCLTVQRRNHTSARPTQTTLRRSFARYPRARTAVSQGNSYSCNIVNSLA